MKETRTSWLTAISGFLLIGMVLTACNGSGANRVESNPPSETATVKPVTVTWMTNGDKVYEWEDSPILRKLTEKTGVKMEFSIAGGDKDQKAGVMIAGGDYPDVIEGAKQTQKFIDAGALIPLDDLIDEYGPNIKKIWGDSLNKLRNPKDGKIYFIGNQPRNRQGEIIDANQSLLIQYDVLDKLGYPTPKTLDDVEKMLKDYMALVPNLDGKPWVPWGLWADTWGYDITINNPAQWVNGLMDDSNAFVNTDDTSVQYFNKTDQFKWYLQWLNKMYNQGMIDENAFITKNDQYKSLVSTGRVLAMIDGTWNIKDSESALRQAGMPERAYARFPILRSGEIQDRSQIDAESYSWGVSITKNAKDPAAIVKMLDYVASTEGTILMNWGIEGTHYDVVDGKRVQKPEIAQKLRDDPEYGKREGLPAGQWGQYGNGYSLVKLDDGDYANPNSPEDVYANADEWTKRVMDKYGIKYWGQMFDLSGKPNPYGFAWTVPIPQDSAAQLAVTKADEIRHSAVPGIITAKSPDEFEKNWTSFQNKLNDAKISEWEKEMSNAIKERLKLWGVTQ